MKNNKIPGLSVAVVDRDGILWTAGFGYTDFDRRTPVTPDTIFSIQSITKALTATLAMCAVQDKLIDLDKPITNYIPDFRINSRFEKNPQDRMTIRLLLVHRAGLIQEAPCGNNFDPVCPSFKAHIDSISKTWLKCRVGSHWNYSNLGMDLVAYILEVQARKPFADYLKEKLFDPLGMPNSSADMTFIRNHPNRAVGHIPYTKDLYVKVPMIGAGGVYTSARDFSKYIQFNPNRGRVHNHALLQKSLFDAMHRGEEATIGNKHGIQGLAIIFRDDGENKLDDDGCGLSGPFWGGGFGFNTFSAWSYDYGVGVLVFSNMTEHNQNEKIAIDIIHELIARKLVRKNETSDSQLWKAVSYNGKEQNKGEQPHPKQFSRYQPSWKKYTGSYKYVNIWKPTLLGRIGRIMGTWGPGDIKVYEKEGYLEINGQRLDEYLPGIFFTKESDCLDFSGPVPLWNGLKIRRK